MTRNRRHILTPLAILAMTVMLLGGLPSHVSWPNMTHAADTAPPSPPPPEVSPEAPSEAPSEVPAETSKSSEQPSSESAEPSDDQAEADTSAASSKDDQAAKPQNDDEKTRASDSPASDAADSPAAKSVAKDKDAPTTSPADAPRDKDTADKDTAPSPTRGKPATAEFLKTLQEKLLTVESVQADFIQTKRLAIFEHQVTIRGRFALQKPDKLVWIVHEPVRYAMHVQGDELRQWDQDTRTVQTIRMGGDPAFKAVTQQIQAWFLGDYQILTEVFDVEVHREKPLALAFIPKKDGMAGQFLEHVDMAFGEDDRYIASLVVHESGGDVTTLRFIHTRLNQPVDPRTWDMPPHDFK